MTVCSWTLTVNDSRGKPTAFTFDLVHGKSPLILGMDVRKYTNTFNLAHQRYIDMKRPTDTDNRIFFTYIIPGDERLRLDIAPHPLANVSTLLGNVHSTAKRAPLAFCKRVHRYTHASEDELREICADAGILDAELDDAIARVTEACEVCTKNGRPKPSRKVSLTHVNEAFNEEIQIDFLFIELKGQKIIVLVITDTGTGFSELAIVHNRTPSVLTHEIENVWICRHGAPKALSADDKYNRRPTLDYLRTHDIKFKPRPARRHNKTGIVERKIGTVKTIFAKMNDENTTASIEALIARAALLSNIFSGSRTLSSFELVRGYSPSIVGVPNTMISQGLLDAHREQVATRALQRLLKSRAPHLPTAQMFQPSDPVWVFYRSTKQNEKDEWIKATVIEARGHYLLARRSNKGRPMHVAYEDLRVAPRSELTTDLMAYTLEEELHLPRVTDEPATHADDGTTPVDAHTPLRLRIQNITQPPVPESSITDGDGTKGGDDERHVDS